MGFVKCSNCSNQIIILPADDDGAYAEVENIAELKPDSLIMARHKDRPIWFKTTWIEVIEVDELVGSGGETYYRLPIRFFKQDTSRR